MGRRHHRDRHLLAAPALQAEACNDGLVLSRDDNI